MPQSQLDDAVRVYNQTVRSHSFETLTVDDVARDYCRHCGKERKSVLKPGCEYDMYPCRGLVG